MSARETCERCGTALLAEGLGACHRCLPAVLGVTFRQLITWCDQGWLQPGRRSGRPAGKRSWPAAEVEIARRMGALVSAGMMAGRAAVLARESVRRSGAARFALAPGITLEIAKPEVTAA